MVLMWMTPTAVAGAKLLTPEKRAALTEAAVAAYRQRGERLLLPRGPCLPLDVHAVTAGCGPACTADGLHFRNSTYDALVQIWANQLRILRRGRGEWESG
jgi:hypothetical protein